LSDEAPIEARIARVRARIDALYGDHALEQAEGVVQVAAVFEDGDAWRVLKIGAGAPTSPTDAFVLALSRARADAIVVTGKILRDEPQLRYALEGEIGADLHAWRRAVLGRVEPPRLLVLSRSVDLDPDHPALHGWATPIVITSTAGAKDAADLGVRVVGLHDPSLEAAIAWARTELSARTITIEAGPSTARTLYEGPVAAIDELMVSIADGPVEASARGGALVSGARARALLPEFSGGAPVSEPSGRWRFFRLTRNRPVADGVRS
jgi:riboflavin biosynthesis pyrimidine reductase